MSKEAPKKAPKKRGNPQNLMPRWEKGKSGNPKGYPKGVRNRSTIAKKVLEMTALLPEEAYQKLKKMFPEIDGKMSVEEVGWIMQSHKIIAKGDLQALTALLESAYGKAYQPIGGKDGGDIGISINVNPYKGKSLEELRLEKQRRERVKRERGT